MALQGFHAARAYSGAPDASSRLLEALALEPAGDGWEARGAERGGLYIYDEPPAERALQGAGSVHHIAWASTIEEHEQWRERAISAGAQPTPVIDRFYFKSIYFREPSGVLFEIATLGPGFTVDEPLEHLGEKLSLPPDYEHLRAEVESNLRPVVNPRAAAPRSDRRLSLERRGPTVVFRDDALNAAGDPRRPGHRLLRAARLARALAGAPRAQRGRRGGARGRGPGRCRSWPRRSFDCERAHNLVALGGGRVIDTAKAVASVTGARVAAIPTTISGAEMTGIHRLPAGAESRVRALVRPALVIADPDGDDEPAGARAPRQLD